MNRRGKQFAGVLAAFALVAGACGSSKKASSTATTAGTTATTAGTTATTSATPTEAFMTPAEVMASWKLYTSTPPGVPLPSSVVPDTAGSLKLTPVTKPDVNGDGKVVIAIATVGDSHDQGFYQSFIDKAQAFATKNGWKLVVVDRVDPANAAQIVKNLCQQGADLVALGDSQLAGAIPAFQAPECAKSAAYVNGGDGVPMQPFFAQAYDHVNQTLYAAGVAAGLLMKANNYTKAGFITGPELDFSKAAAKAWGVGIKSVVSNATVVNTFTGDFDDSAKGQEAAKAQISQGVQVMYPYLGGATNAAVKEANAANVAALTPGNYRCADPNYKFAISVEFDPGYYLLPFLQSFHDGTYQLGQAVTYNMGKTPDPNIIFCNGTPDELSGIAQTISDIGSGKINPTQLVGG